MLASDIITKCRYSLSDTDKSRWTDERLLSLLNDGLQDLAKDTVLFTEKLYYQVNDLQVDIDLVEYATKVVRVEYLDAELPVLSFDDMDEKYGSDWQTEEGTEVEALVIDNQERGLYKLYPIVSNALNPHVEISSPYGIVTDFSYSDIEPVLSTVYGDMAGVPDNALLTFYYIRKHETVTALTDTLYIDDIMQKMLQHYIVGFALRDNMDEQNRALGLEDLEMYEQKKDEYSMEKSRNFSRNMPQSTYRAFI